MPAILRRPRTYRRLTFAATARRRIQQFGPYKSLAVLVVPMLIVEPVKMTGLAFVGLGHWVGGACMIVGGYSAGFLILDRLYRVVKSKPRIGRRVPGLSLLVALAAQTGAVACRRRYRAESFLEGKLAR